MTKILHPGCDHCNHPMFAAMRCDVCGKVHSTDDEPQQEVVGPEEEAAIDAAAKGGVVIYSDAESSVPEGWKHEIDDLRKRATCGCGACSKRPRNRATSAGRCGDGHDG